MGTTTTANQYKGQSSNWKAHTFQEPRCHQGQMGQHHQEHRAREHQFSELLLRNHDAEEASKEIQGMNTEIAELKAMMAAMAQQLTNLVKATGGA